MLHLTAETGEVEVVGEAVVAGGAVAAVVLAALVAAVLVVAVPVAHGNFWILTKVPIEL